jgi:hypothetical protein
MRKALIVGNGKSRSGVVIPRPRYDFIFGCNQFYKENPNFLFAVDRPMIEEILAAGYSGVVYTRKKSTVGLELPSNWRFDEICDHNCSGVAAIGIAWRMGIEQIDLLGFDLGVEGVRNNIYDEDRRSEAKTVSYKKWEVALRKYGKQSAITRIIDDKCVKNVCEKEIYIKDWLLI